MKKWMYAVFPCLILGLFIFFYLRRGPGAGNGDQTRAGPGEAGGAKREGDPSAAQGALDKDLTGVAAPIPTGEPPIIAKARAYLGSDGALDAVKSIHFVGTLVTTDPADPTKTTRSAIEIISQKPDRQRVQEVSEKMIEISALDGYDGWRRQQDLADPTKWQQTLLGPAQIKYMQANTWENLAFYRGLQSHGGRVEDQGPATIDGIVCQKIAFIHTPAVVFYRYFDVGSGRLVFTKTESGATIREQGEIVVRGIRLPKTLVQTSPLPNGQTQTITINFEKVMLNETLPGDLFAVPMLLSK
jgi:hypothetical protein